MHIQPPLQFSAVKWCRNREEAFATHQWVTFVQEEPGPGESPWEEKPGLLIYGDELSLEEQVIAYSLTMGALPAWLNNSGFQRLAALAENERP
jgi:hypothetical protein